MTRLPESWYVVKTRNRLIIRLKDELDSAIELVTHSRESLTNELNTEWA